MTRPTGGELHAAALLAVAAACLNALYSIATRVLAGHDRPRRPCSIPGSWARRCFCRCSPSSGPAPRRSWAGSCWRHWALSARSGHWLLILAHRRAPASVMAPFFYSQLSGRAVGFLFSATCRTLDARRRRHRHRLRPVSRRPGAGVAPRAEATRGPPAHRGLGLNRLRHTETGEAVGERHRAQSRSRDVAVLAALLPRAARCSSACCGWRSPSHPTTGPTGRSRMSWCSLSCRRCSPRCAGSRCRGCLGP